MSYSRIINGIQEILQPNANELYCDSINIATSCNPKAIQTLKAFGATCDGVTDDKLGVISFFESPNSVKLQKDCLGEGQVMTSLSESDDVNFARSLISRNICVLNSVGGGGLGVYNKHSYNTQRFGVEYLWGYYKSLKEGSSTKIIFTGDSTTHYTNPHQDFYEDIPEVVGDYFASKGVTNVVVVNAGISGETSTGIKNRISDVISQNPQLLIFRYGINDILWKYVESELVPLLATYRSNMETVLDAVRTAYPFSSGNCSILMMNTSDSFANTHILRRLSPINKYLSKKYQCAFIDPLEFLEFVDDYSATNETWMKQDGLHVNVIYNMMLFEYIKSFICPSYLDVIFNNDSVIHGNLQTISGNPAIYASFSSLHLNKAVHKACLSSGNASITSNGLTLGSDVAWAKYDCPSDADGGNKFSCEFTFTPSYTGGSHVDAYIFGLVPSNYYNYYNSLNMVLLLHSGTNLNLYSYDSSGLAIHNGVTLNTLDAVSGTSYNLRLYYNVEFGATKLWVDGISSVTDSSTGARIYATTPYATYNTPTNPNILFGSENFAAGLFSIKDFRMWPYGYGELNDTLAIITKPICQSSDEQIMSMVNTVSFTDWATTHDASYIVSREGERYTLTFTTGVEAPAIAGSVAVNFIFSTVLSTLWRPKHYDCFTPCVIKLNDNQEIAVFSVSSSTGQMTITSSVVTTIATNCGIPTGSQISFLGN